MTRVITRNAMLYDGSPRRENGWRAHLQVEAGPTAGFPNRRSIVYISPLFGTEAGARSWWPDYDPEQDR